MPPGFNPSLGYDIKQSNLLMDFVWPSAAFAKTTLSVYDKVYI